MGLADLIDDLYKSEVLPDDVAEVADDVIDGFWINGEKAPEYREHLLEEYRNNAGCPPKRDENGAYRTPEETRLDLAWNEVAGRFERSEENIRGCVLRGYDQKVAALEAEGEEDVDRPTVLRREFDEILEKAGYE